MYIIVRTENGRILSYDDELCIIFDDEHQLMTFCYLGFDENKDSDFDKRVLIKENDEQFEVTELITISYSDAKGLGRYVEVYEMSTDKEYLKESGGCSGCKFEQKDANDPPCDTCHINSNYMPK